MPTPLMIMEILTVKSKKKKMMTILADCYHHLVTMYYLTINELVNQELTESTSQGN